MKKLIALLGSLIICTGIMTAIPSNAIIVVDIENNRYEKSDELDEYFSGEGEIYKKTGTTGTIVKYTGTDKISGQEYAYYCPMGYDLSLYVDIDEAEADLLKEYILTNLPGITSEETEEGIKLIYNENISFEEQFEIAKKIKSDTGLVSYAVVVATILNFDLLGDLSSDNAITPTDAANLLSYYADMQSGIALASAEGSVDYSIIGDFNNDGKITPSDAAGILEYYADQQTKQ